MTAPVCPRCGHFIPSDERAGEYPGALSRTDNQTEVCSDCGRREAFEHMTVNRDGLLALQGEPREWWTSQRANAWYPSELRE